MNEVIKRTDLAIEQLTTNGGVLLPEQANKFIRKVIDQPTILQRIRVQPMNGPEMNINKVGFGERIFRAAPSGTAPYAQDDGSHNRYLAAADRARPVTEQIKLKTKEVMCEIHIPYDVLEDNIEKEDFEQTILALAAEQGALDFEELILRGDTALAATDPYLGLVDGILKRANAHIVDGTDIPVDAELWNEVKKAMPTKYRRNLKSMNYFVEHDVESDYRLKISKRGTGLGDAMTTTDGPLPVFGMGMLPAVMLHEGTGLLANPQNFIFGVQRQVTLERDRDIRGRMVVLVMTARVDVQIEEKDAVVKIENIGDVTVVP